MYIYTNDYYEYKFIWRKKLFSILWSLQTNFLGIDLQTNYPSWDYKSNKRN